MHRVFVYGTLKRNEPNHHWLTDKENGNGTFVGSATTVEKFPLVISSRYNIPYVIDAQGQGMVNSSGIIVYIDPFMYVLERPRRTLSSR